MLKSQYNFVDISFLANIGGNQYIDLSDYSFVYENEKMEFKNLRGNPEFLITFCSYIKGDRYVADITLEELMSLARISNGQFTNHLTYKVDDDIQIYLEALIAAKKILNYNYGKAERVDKDLNIYNFKIHKYVDGKHVYPTIFQKQFYKVA